MSSDRLRRLFDDGAGFARRRVDPGRVRWSLRERRAPYEALRMSGEGGGQRLVAHSKSLCNAAMVHVGGREQAEARVPVLVVVPVEQSVSTR